MAKKVVARLKKCPSPPAFLGLYLYAVGVLLLPLVGYLTLWLLTLAFPLVLSLKAKTIGEPKR